MKHILFLLPIFIISALHAQPLVPVPAQSVDEKYFISKEFMTSKGMKADPAGTTTMMHRWSSIAEKAMILMVFDIRFVFSNEADAKTYFGAKLSELSEGGALTNKSLDTLGTSESKVYGANPAMMSAFGDLDLAQQNFVFRVKNVVAKVFVGSSKKASYAEVSAYAKEAIKRIKVAN